MCGSNKQLKSGYIAVTSAILISFLILVITGALSLSLYFSRFNVFSSQAKEGSLTLAEGCADMALLRLAENPAYGGNETVIVTPSSTCAILPIVSQGAQKTIKTSATFQRSTSIIKVIVNQPASAISLLSWEEVPQ